MSQVPISNTDATLVNGGGPTAFMSSPAWKKAVALAATSLAQDIIKNQSLEWKKAFMLGLADWTAVSYFRGYFTGTLASWSGESYYSGLVAEGAAVAFVLYLSRIFGLTGARSTEGPLIGAPNLGSNLVSNIVEILIDSSILIGERELLLWAAGKAGMIAT